MKAALRFAELQPCRAAAPVRTKGVAAGAPGPGAAPVPGRAKKRTIPISVLLRQRASGGRPGAPSGDAASWLHWKGKFWSITGFSLQPAGQPAVEVGGWSPSLSSWGLGLVTPGPGRLAGETQAVGRDGDALWAQAQAYKCDVAPQDDFKFRLAS